MMIMIVRFDQPRQVRCSCQQNEDMEDLMGTTQHIESTRLQSLRYADLEYMIRSITQVVE